MCLKKKQFNFKKIFKSKYFYLPMFLIAGTVLTIIFSNKICNIDILFGIGTGILGSSTVSIFIEIYNDMRNNRKKMTNRKIILDDINILDLFKTELQNYSSYCYLYNNSMKLSYHNETIDNVLVQIENFSKEIDSHIKYEKTPDGVVKYAENLNKKNEYLFINVLPNYQTLLNNLEKIILEKNFYINSDLFTQNEINNLIELKSYTQRIVKLSEAKSEIYIIEAKKNFYDYIKKEILDLERIDRNMILKINYFK